MLRSEGSGRLPGVTAHRAHGFGPTANGGPVSTATAPSAEAGFRRSARSMERGARWGARLGARLDATRAARLGVGCPPATVPRRGTARTEGVLVTQTQNGKGRNVPTGTARGGSALRTVDVPRVAVDLDAFGKAQSDGGKALRVTRPALVRAFLSGGGLPIGRGKAASTSTVRRFVAATAEVIGGPGEARDAFIREHGEAGLLVIPAEREGWDGRSVSAEGFAPSFVRKATAHGWAVDSAALEAALGKVKGDAQREAVLLAARQVCAARWVLGHGVGAQSAGSKTLRDFITGKVLGGDLVDAGHRALEAAGILPAAEGIYAAGVGVDFGPGLIDSAPFGGWGFVFID